MSTAILPVSRPHVNPSEFHIGLAVVAKTDDSFRNKPGTIQKIVHGAHPAFYVQLADPSFRELLYFAGYELEPEPVCTQQPQQDAPDEQQLLAEYDAWNDEQQRLHDAMLDAQDAAALDRERDITGYYSQYDEVRA